MYALSTCSTYYCACICVQIGLIFAKWGWRDEFNWVNSATKSIMANVAKLHVRNTTWKLLLQALRCLHSQMCTNISCSTGKFTLTFYARIAVIIINLLQKIISNELCKYLIVYRRDFVIEFVFRGYRNFRYKRHSRYYFQSKKYLLKCEISGYIVNDNL